MVVRVDSSPTDGRDENVGAVPNVLAGTQMRSIKSTQFWKLFRWLGVVVPQLKSNLDVFRSVTISFVVALFPSERANEESCKRVSRGIEQGLAIARETQQPPLPRRL